MKISIQSILFVILIVYTRFFAFYPDSFIQLLFITFFIFINLLLLFRIKINNRGYFRNCIYFFLFYVIIEMIISLFVYKQSLFHVIIQSYYYFTFLSYFIYIKLIKNEKDILITKKIIIYVATILISIFIIQTILHKSGLYFINIQIIERNNRLRITLFAILINIAFLISYGEVLKNGIKTSKLFIFNFIIALYFIIFIQQTRSIILIIAICIFIGFLVKFLRYIKKGTKELLFLIIICFSFLGTITIFPYTSMYESLEKDYGVVAREQAIDFYIAQIKEKPLFGMGIIKPIKGDQSYSLVHGPLGIYYKDDVGIIGFVNNFGIIGLGWYIFIMYKSYKLLRRLYINKLLNQNIELLLVYIYIVCSTGNIIIMDPQRILFFPLLLSLLEVQVNNEISH